MHPRMHAWALFQPQVPHCRRGELSQEDRTFRSKRRIAVMIVSSVALLALIIAVVAIAARGHRDNQIDGVDASYMGSDGNLAAIMAVCNGTVYPDSCYSSLSQVSNETEFDPAKIFQASLWFAMKQVIVASNRLDELKATNQQDPRFVEALDVCRELLRFTHNKLNESTTSTDLTSAQVVGDFKTWLSASITYQDMCIEGFANATIDQKNQVAGILANSTELSSNSLAILTQIYKALGHVKLRRRLLSSDHEGGLPSWVSGNVRNLLQAPDIRKNANYFVAKDGTGMFTTISEAVKAAPSGSSSRIVIYVKKGVYHEKVEVLKPNIMMIGDGSLSTIVTGSLNVVDGTPTSQTATFAVHGSGFIAQDMCFQNTAGAIKQQAVAMLSNSDKSVFYRCRFDGFQDTLFTLAQRQFFRECDILGTVDFIFGDASVVFQRCNIIPRVPLFGQPDVITAQGKSDPNEKTGMSFYQCNVTTFEDLSSVNVYLGRPWRDYSTTVFIKTSLPQFIQPQGWMPWNAMVAPPSTIFYGEFMNTGQGSSIKKRVDWNGVRNSLSVNEANEFTVDELIDGRNWIPGTGVPFKSAL